LPRNAVDAHGWRGALHGAIRSTVDVPATVAQSARSFRALS